MASLITLTLITLILSCNSQLANENANPIEIVPNNLATNHANGCCAFTEGDACYCKSPTSYHDCNCDSIKSLSIVYLGDTTAKFIKFYNSFRYPLCKFNNVYRGEEIHCDPLENTFTEGTTFKIKNDNNEICAGYIDTSCTGRSILNSYGEDCDDIVISGYIDTNNGICDDGFEPCTCDAFNNIHLKSTASKLRLIIPAIPVVSTVFHNTIESDNDYNDDANEHIIINNNMNNNPHKADLEDMVQLDPIIDNASDDMDIGDESSDNIVIHSNNHHTDDINNIKQGNSVVAQADIEDEDSRDHEHKLILFGIDTDNDNDLDSSISSSLDSISFSFDDNDLDNYGVVDTELDNDLDTDLDSSLSSSYLDSISDSMSSSYLDSISSSSDEHVLIMGNNNNIISDSSDDLFEEEDDSMNDPLEYDIEPSESLEIYSAQMNGKKKIKTGTKLSVKNELNHLNGIWKGTNYDMIAFYSILVIVILNVIVFSYCLCIKGKIKNWKNKSNGFGYQNGVRSSECDFIESSISELEADNDDITDEEDEYSI